MIRNYIEAKIIIPLKAKLEASRSRVSGTNRLVNSFMFGVDDHQLVSPDNRLIHADLGKLDLSTPVEDKKQ